MSKYKVEVEVRRNSEGYFVGDASFFPAPVSEGHEIKTIYVAPKQMYATKEEAAANALIEMGYRIARGPRDEEVDKKLQAISDAFEKSEPMEPIKIYGSSDSLPDFSRRGEK